MSCKKALMAAGGVFIFLGALFNLISFWTSYWKKATFGDITMNLGLFMYCEERNGGDECIKIPEPRGYVLACRVMTVLAFIVTSFCVVTTLEMMCKCKDISTKSLVIFAVVMCTIAEIILLVAIILYAENYNEPEVFEEDADIVLDWALGYSFLLNVLAFIFLVLGCILLVLRYKLPLQKVKSETSTTRTTILFRQPPNRIDPAQSLPPAYGQTVYYGQPNQQYYIATAYMRSMYGQPDGAQPFTTVTSGQLGVPPKEQNSQSQPDAGPAVVAPSQPVANSNDKTPEEGTSAEPQTQ